MNNRKIYIEQIALDARNRLVEEKIIAKSDKSFDLEQLKNIVSFYAGELRVYSEQQKTSLEKISNKRYVIHYCHLNNYFQVIHELGHAFLDFDEMCLGQKYYFNGSGNKDIEASLFARAFIMPRESFEQVVISNINNGKYSIQNVAEEYKIDYLEVLARGEELNFGC